MFFFKQPAQHLLLLLLLLCDAFNLPCDDGPYVCVWSCLHQMLTCCARVCVNDCVLCTAACCRIVYTEKDKEEIEDYVEFVLSPVLYAKSILLLRVVIVFDMLIVLFDETTDGFFVSD